MSSSSDDDVMEQPVKCIRRRKRNFSRETIQPTNLYSTNIMPTINRVNEKAIKDMAEELSKPTIIPVCEATSYVSDLNRSSQSSDDEIQFVTETKTNRLSLTPPPEPSNKPKNQKSSIERKRLKLLSNIASVVSTVNQELDQSVHLETEANETSPNIKGIYTMVKIQYQSRIYKYPHMKTLPFKQIFEQFARDVCAEKHLLLLTLNDDQINEDDTPESVGLSVVDYIEAVLIDEKVLKQTRSDTNNKFNCINIHFQCKFQKTKKTYSVNKLEPLNVVMQKYASAIGHNIQKLRFYFDGDVIDGLLSAEQLEIENNYCIDVMRTDKRN